MLYLNCYKKVKYQNWAWFNAVLLQSIAKYLLNPGIPTASGVAATVRFRMFIPGCRVFMQDSLRKVMSYAPLSGLSTVSLLVSVSKSHNCALVNIYSSCYFALGYFGLETVYDDISNTRIQPWHLNLLFIYAKFKSLVDHEILVKKCWNILRRKKVSASPSHIFHIVGKKTPERTIQI